MKQIVRLMWLLVIAGGIALCRWYTYGPWWRNAGNDFVRFGPEPVVLTWGWILLLIVAILASRGSKGVAGNKSRFQFSIATLLFVLTVAAVAMGLAKWCFHEPRPTCRTLPEVLAGKYDGFDLVQGPDRQGPYEDMGAVCAGEGDAVSGSFWANGKTQKFHVPGVPGEEFRVVGLIPQDGGGPTYVVLRRHVAPASPVGQSTK